MRWLLLVSWIALGCGDPAPAASAAEPAGPDFTAPVIFLAARRNKEAVQQALEAGGNDFMIKPFQPRAVLERLARWLPEE